MRTRLGMTLATLAFGLIAVACSGNTDGDAGDSARGEGADATADDGGGAGGASDGEVAAGVPAGQALQASRDIIYTAELSMTVDDVEVAARDVVAAAQEAGGYQSGGSLDLEGDPVGTVTVRVPSGQFDATVERLRGLGKVADQRVDASDVTDQVVDLESRLRSTRASLERLLGFLAGAHSVADIATLEAELANRETQVEQLEGQLRVLQDQVSLSTVTVRLGEKAPPPLENDPKPSDDIPGFLRGLRHGWVALVNTVQVGLTGFGAVLPFVLLVTPLAYAAWRWRRRTRTQSAPVGVEA